jgi:release factor glutamine methyltransferase
VTTVRRVAGILAAAGIPSPEHDARTLVRHAEDHCLGLDDLVAARAARVPLQHLTGSAGFRYLELAVGPGVFVPRPETELLVDAVLAAVAGLTSPVVVDLCAGSGAIGLSVAHECPGAVVHLVERSADAYEWLARNAHDYDSAEPGSASRIQLHHEDLADAPLGLDGLVDVVVSNPPYVPLDERGLVDPEVRDHDPAEALWAGEDGLEVIRRVIDRARTLLRPGGQLVVEHSERHEAIVPELVEAAGFVDVVDRLDLAGRPRFSLGTLPC